MKVGIDARVLARQKKTGVDYYTRGLLRGLISEAPEFDFILGYFGKEVNLGVSGKNVRQRRIWWLPLKILQRLQKYSLGLPFDVISGIKADVFIFPDFVSLPLVAKAKSVVIIYDLSFEKHPQYVAPANQKFLQKNVPISAAGADHIVTISQSTKKELIEEYGLDRSKISVIYPAVDRNFFQKTPRVEIENVKQKYNIPGPYILFTSTLEPRKNILGLIEAYKDLPDSLRGKYSLVLAGGKGWLDEGIQEKITLEKELGLNIITTGYFPEAELPSLYSGASAFVYPSHYEGFGMPPLEAMACGTPVITSSTSSLPEAAGEAAIMVNPKDTTSISKAMVEVLSSKKLADELVLKGYAQVEKFTWQNSAKKLIEVLEKLQ